MVHLQSLDAPLKQFDCVLQYSDAAGEEEDRYGEPHRRPFLDGFQFLEINTFAVVSIRRSVPANIDTAFDRS